MKIKCIAILASLSVIAGSQAKDAKSILQQGLFAEEAEQNFDKAASSYEAVLKEYDAQRRYAVAALYRLAEVRRKQKREKEAALYYQRVLDEFPKATPQARLSREHLSAMGVSPLAKPSEPKIPNDPDEDRELRRLMMLAENSPSRLFNQVPLARNNTGSQTTEPLNKAARQGWLRVATWLLDQAGVEKRKLLLEGLPLYEAASAGHLEMCKFPAGTRCQNRSCGGNPGRGDSKRLPARGQLAGGERDRYQCSWPGFSRSN